MVFQAEVWKTIFNSIGYFTTMAGTPCEATGLDALTLNYGACKKPVPADMLNSGLIIIWGTNPAWTASHQMRYIFGAQEAGAKIIVIDPILTATAARSDLYLQIRPGMDGQLALGMAKVLLERNLINHEFLEEHTCGWPEYRKYIAAIDLEQVASVTGIPSEDIHELACLYGTAKPATIWLGMGPQRSINGGQNCRAIDSLAALTGNIGKPGGNVHYVTLEPWMKAGKYNEYKPPSGSIGVLANDGVYCNRTLGTGRFLDLAAMDPPIQLLWVAGRNPVAQDPDSTTIRKILEQIPMVVVADQYMTATAQMADFLLPIASPFEFEDVVISFWHYGVALNEQAILPLGECKSDLAIMLQLARILEELEPGFTNFPAKQTPSEWLEQELHQLCNTLGIANYNELRDQYIQMNMPPVPWHDCQFLTPSGKYEFFSTLAQDHGLASLPEIDGIQPTSESYPLRLFTVRSYAALNSQCRDSPRLSHLGKTSLVLLNPELAKYKNIGEDDNIKIYNQFGELQMRAVLSSGIQRDMVVVFINNTGNNMEELNSLIALTETDMGHIVSDYKGMSYNNSFVNIVRME